MKKKGSLGDPQTSKISEVVMRRAHSKQKLKKNNKSVIGPNVGMPIKMNADLKDESRSLKHDESAVVIGTTSTESLSPPPARADKDETVKKEIE